MKNLFRVLMIPLVLAGLSTPGRASICDTTESCNIGTPIEILEKTVSSDAIQVGEPVTLTVSARDIDQCGDPYTCEDGIEFEWEGVVGGGSHTVSYDTPGTYTVTCTVDDTRYTGNPADDDPVDVVFTLEVADRTDPATGDEVKPDYEQAGCPEDGSPGSGPSECDPVDLATGDEVYRLGPDIEIYNPYGSPFTFQRTYFTGAARRKYGSAGLSSGWVHNYDYAIRYTDRTQTSWADLSLIFPRGGVVRLRPVLDTQTQLPTGELRPVDSQGSPRLGVPYGFRGSPYAVTGTWESITMTQKDGTQFVFKERSGRHLIEKIIDRFGNTTLLERDLGDRITAVNALVDDNPYQVMPLARFDYTRFQSCLSNTSFCTFTYRLTSIVDLTGSTEQAISYSYSFPGSVAPRSLSGVSQFGSQDSQVTYTYTSTDADGTPLSSGPFLSGISVPAQTTSGTATATIRYYSDGKVKELEDGNGHKRRYTYLGYDINDPNTGRTNVSVYSAGQSTPLETWTVKYDANKFSKGYEQTHSTFGTVGTTITRHAQQRYKPDTIVDEKGRQTKFYYDTFGNVTRVEDPRTTTVLTYDTPIGTPGRLRTIKEGDKKEVRVEYGYRPYQLHYVETVSPFDPTQWVRTELIYATRTSSPYGLISEIREPGNNWNATRTTTFGYESTPKFARPVSVTEQDNYTTRTTGFEYYNAPGRRLKAVTDPLNIRTEFAYNPAGQLSWIVFPEPTVGAGYPKRGYDYLFPGGPLTAVTDYAQAPYASLGSVVRTESYTYGPEYELKTRGSTTGSAEPVTLDYDALYRVTRVQDGNANPTWYDYNTDGNLWRIRYPQADIPTHRDIIEYAGFDRTGNPAQRIDGNNLTTLYGYWDQYDDKLRTVTYPNAEIASYTYDQYGRLDLMSNPYTTVDYNYDDLDNTVLSTTTYKDNGVNLFTAQLGYTYYPDGSRRTMQTPAGTFQYEYSARGLMNRIQNPLGEQTYWRHDANGWLEEQYNNFVFSAYYTRNRHGHLSGLTNTEFYTYGYASDFYNLTRDALGNLTGLQAYNDYLGYSGATTYRYSPVGQTQPYGQLYQEQTNRRTGLLETTPFSYDAAFNPQQFRSLVRSANPDNQLIGPEAYAYDGNGNPRRYRNFPLNYNPNLPEQGFKYDGENRLIQYDEDGNTVLTPPEFEARYGADGLRVWKREGGGPRTFFLYDDDDELVCEFNAGGTVTALNTFGANGLVSRWTPATGSRFYLYDPMGNVAQRLDASGQVVSSDLYDAYGLRLDPPDIDDADPYGWGAQWGYYRDQSLGLVLMTHRYYDPQTGRFLTRDPIGYAGGVNLYGYVGNDPVNWVDPLGHKKKKKKENKGFIDTVKDFFNDLKVVLGFGGTDVVNVIAKGAGGTAGAVGGVACPAIDVALAAETVQNTDIWLNQIGQNKFDNGLAGLGGDYGDGGYELRDIYPNQVFGYGVDTVRRDRPRPKRKR